ncbi:MAG TPA: cupin domain-containing protein [Gemmatimonadaceae bacterium]
MRIRYSVAVLALVACQSARVAAQAPALKWGPAPSVFPAGAKLAVLAGDPGKSGEYTVRLDMPNGYTIAPHFHPTDENVTVIKGTFLVGMGDKVSRSKMLTLPTGGFITAGAQMHHYAIARGRTIVQVHGVGPFQLTYVNPADDPSKKVANK